MTLTFVLLVAAALAYAVWRWVLVRVHDLPGISDDY